MSNLKKYEKASDLNKMIVHIPNKDEAFNMVKAVLASIPEKYNLQMPAEGVESQINNITDFVLKHFKTVSPNEIMEAFDLNAAQKFTPPIRTRFFDLNTVGAVVNQFKIWKSNTRLMGQQQELNIEINVQAALNNDYRILKRNPNFSITTHVEEKWSWLCANRNEFDHDIDEAKLKDCIDYYEKQKHDKNSVGYAMAQSKWYNPELMGMTKYKADRIKEYLQNIINQKPESNEN